MNKLLRKLKRNKEEKQVCLCLNEDCSWVDSSATTIGILSWSDGKMKFKGDAEESARVFFEEFLKPRVDQYIRERLSNE